MAAKSLLSLLVATIAISSVLAQTPMDWQPLLEQQNLVLRQVVQTLHLTRGGPVGPEETDACFDWYLNNQTLINEAYYKEYNGCRDRATAAKKLLSAQSALERQDLLNDGHALCSDLSACEYVDDGLRFFQCYSKASSGNSANLLNITVTSERIADKLTISYQAINDTERVCTTEARVKNVNELAVSRTYLNECLNGDWSPPNAVPIAPEEVTIVPTASAEESTQSAESQRLLAHNAMARLNPLKRV
uniref:Hepatocyte nuclear factor 1-alpha n=1 Tax=Zeugodacus cucurbitae TaxID=28588 RepID=A0A0A1WE78_ZEUCU